MGENGHPHHWEGTETRRWKYRNDMRQFRREWGIHIFRPMCRKSASFGVRFVQLGFHFVELHTRLHLNKNEVKAMPFIRRSVRSVFFIDRFLAFFPHESREKYRQWLEIETKRRRVKVKMWAVWKGKGKKVRQHPWSPWRRFFSLWVLRRASENK